ncbi:MAG: radical SAM protein [Candidatus Lernaella stagnicola]|nr:radical SAM protein [Candidatus Lernaella stagnicola]
MRVLIVRPPKYLWPYMNEQDNFLLPQALVCLGAELRRRGHDVVLLDAMPLKMGWKSLERTIRDLKPQIVAAGDSETLYQHETGRVFQTAKHVDPSIFTVAGGTHFSHLPQYSFGKYPIDAIVRGEGEDTFGELVDTLEGGGDIEKVLGLALPNDDGTPRFTGHRPLIANLDDLALPAYDLMPMDKYGTARYLFSPGGVTMHHSRGCIDGCAYCACWLQMARRSGDLPNEILQPHYRQRSVEPVLDEMELLRYKYNKSCVVFVDDTFNVNPKWMDTFAEEKMRRGLDSAWFGFMRADFLHRDLESGLFGKLIRSGLTHICVGMERADDQELADMQKHNMHVERNTATVKALRRRFPELFLQTTFIVGTRNDSEASLNHLLDYVEDLDPDYPAFHPMTPVPGTKTWEDAKQNGWLEITDFARYDWMTPVMGTDHMSRDDLEWKIWEMNKKYMNPFRVMRGLFCRHTYRRRMYIWWLKVSINVGIDFILDRILPSRSTSRKAQLSEYVGMIKPVWYDH